MAGTLDFLAAFPQPLCQSLGLLIQTLHFPLDFVFKLTSIRCCQRSSRGRGREVADAQIDPAVSLTLCLLNLFDRFFARLCRPGRLGRHVRSR